MGADTPVSLVLCAQSCIIILVRRDGCQKLYTLYMHNLTHLWGRNEGGPSQLEAPLHPAKVLRHDREPAPLRVTRSRHYPLVGGGGEGNHKI